MEDSAGSCTLWSIILAAFIAALSGLTTGYGLGYPSTALRDLAEFADDRRAFPSGSRESELFAVSRIVQDYIWIKYKERHLDWSEPERTPH